MWNLYFIWLVLHIADYCLLAGCSETVTNVVIDNTTANLTDVDDEVAGNFVDQSNVMSELRFNVSDSVDEEELVSAGVRVRREKIDLLLKSVFSKGRHHHTEPEWKANVTSFIHNMFLRMGLRSSLLRFNLIYKTKNKTKTIPGVNVVGILAGPHWGTPKDRFFILGAHYDTVSKSPGMVDNGSGTAAVLEVARAMTEIACRPEYSIIFATFDLEEEGKIGSMHFVNQFLAKQIAPVHNDKEWPSRHIVGAILLDMVLAYNNTANSQLVKDGWKSKVPETVKQMGEHENKGNFIAMFQRRPHDDIISKHLMTNWNKLAPNSAYRIQPFTLNFPENATEKSMNDKYGDFMRSDHMSFWFHRSSLPPTLPAVLLTDMGPWRGEMSKCYHQPCDVYPETGLSEVQLDMITDLTQVVATTVTQITKSTCAGRPLFM